MEYILGIDIGTGSTKAVALDLNYLPVKTSQIYYGTNSSQTGYSEQEPEALWTALVSCINEMLDRMTGLPIAIGLSSAMHSLIAVDDQGKALAPMMTWADSRSAAIAEELKTSEKGMEIYRITGTPIHAMSPLCKLIWLNRHEPELFHSAYKFISIKEYIWFRLFNEFTVDHSIASATGLFDVESRIWSREALELAGIGREQLSAAVGTGYTKRGLAPSAGLLARLQDTPFVIGASDGCLANLGTFATAPGVAALTIGTSGAVRLSSKIPVHSPDMIFSYVLDEQTYICGGPVNNGGIALEWLLKDVLEKEINAPEDYEVLFAEVENVAAGSNGLLFLPYLNGERSPIWDEASSAAFFGLRLQHKQAHLVRAVLEGICFALKDAMDAVERATGAIRQVHVSGGFVHSQVWMQMLADVTGKELVLIQAADASAVGAAYLAVKAMNLETRYPELPAAEKRLVLPGEGNHQCYGKRFLVYKQLYGSLRDLMQAQ